ncbi:MAG: hypothetical protein A3C02_01075 [Candidatus Andersenbacteria bacterium RIFCSPHIGHO2_02_FULL_45_11]|uniref:Short-chain dehydrogenase n=1 Tax=Candidatus Andersenbacteria bacterium RIFCSPHIGHO2_12_FULL_45_11 TaxID=1797281 RepID=A0A1G1X1M1_9BACT|nr:MAG: hypothetical protein A2805_04075 [Candidatus Andersenbacteria bacterium RIFCSPHIGHO2_01_FULL_46_36]OGY33574.1 MAG: hypothetical protein A3C02_01075 [Candidatus Andersenbacteria bacterium RIFCSPHIGHO2_02_FULL_45_11]OGY33864.1 MAG: hypothetical protein A3D99_03965 [Candidatus Andersenbacteria bacterium RIFCSPHIGHO2_12_FULL_45_11]
MDLKNKIILITGGKGFLGEYFSQALTAAGATVITGDIHPDADVQMDVTSTESIRTAFSDILATRSRIDVVVNNAAIDPKFDGNADQNAKLFENYPEELIRKSLDVNLLGYTLVAQEAIRHMLAQKSGNIINVSSIYGMVGPDQSIYPNGTQKPVDYFITKGGVVMLTKFLATTYGKQNIRVNTLTLGGVFKEHGKDFIDRYGARTPLGRMANPDDVGGPLVFLASDASSYMTGANLVVDGGWTAW